MDSEVILNELANIRASAKVLHDRAANLEKLLVASTASNPKKRPGFDVELACVLAKREKKYTKKTTAPTGHRGGIQ